MVRLRYLLLNIIILLSLTFKCQDKLYFLDGTNKVGKITEIGPEEIIIKIDFDNISFPRSSVLLLEFKNGSTEIINKPTENITRIAEKKENFHFKQAKKELYYYNQISVNSLALCNADISVFYERILPKKRLGVGVMGAYNINQYANAFNINIAVLSNAKKNYDIGAFINFYPSRFEKRTRLHFGLMMKYTSFNYSSVKNDSTRIGNSVSAITTYSAAKGGQLATLITMGSHSDISNNFFIKTIFGIGAFKLRGDYKTQYNQEFNNINNQSNNNTQPVTYNFLPKFYFGINIGFKL